MKRSISQGETQATVNLDVRLEHEPESGLSSWSGSFSNASAFLEPGSAKLQLRGKEYDIIIDSMNMANPTEGHFVGSGVAPKSLGYAVLHH